MSALIELLARLRALIEAVPDAAYTARPVPSISGSMGEHVRHCLDHVAVLAAATGRRRISYDHRTRATSDEARRSSAIARIDTLLVRLSQISDDELDAAVLVDTLLEKDGSPSTGLSSLARELAFVVHHTIHHFAVIALLLDCLGVAVPARFAHAPSTLKAA